MIQFKQFSLQYGRVLLFLLLAAGLVVGTSAPLYAVAEKATICHKPGTADEKTLEVSASAVSAHLGHGDHAGECGPQISAGCAAVNAVVPDPQTDSNNYFFAITDLTFNPGEVLHVDMTIRIDLPDIGNSLFVGVRNGSGGILAADSDTVSFGTKTSSVDYTVVAGDDADGLIAQNSRVNGDPFVLVAVNFSCTPA